GLSPSAIHHQHRISGLSHHTHSHTHTHTHTHAHTHTHKRATSLKKFFLCFFTSVRTLPNANTPPHTHLKCTSTLETLPNTAKQKTFHTNTCTHNTHMLEDQ